MCQGLVIIFLNFVPLNAKSEGEKSLSEYRTWTEIIRFNEFWMIVIQKEIFFYVIIMDKSFLFKSYWAWPHLFLLIAFFIINISLLFIVPFQFFSRIFFNSFVVQNSQKNLNIFYVKFIKRSKEKSNSKKFKKITILFSGS